MGRSKSGLTRRQFISTAAGSLASAGLACMSTGVGFPLTAAADPGSESREIIARTLGRTGLKVPIVGMGAGSITDPGLLQACLDVGIRLFHTSGDYLNGKSEENVARARMKSSDRDKVVIMTGGLEPWKREGKSGNQVRDLLIKSIDESLRRMQTDRVEVFLVHDVRDAATVGETAIKEGLERIKKDGKARFVGLAFHTAQREIIEAAIADGSYDVLLIGLNFTMAGDVAVTAAARAAEAGLGVVAMKTQAGGRHYSLPDDWKDYDNSDINSASLKWALNTEGVTAAVPASANWEQLRRNVAVGRDLTYTDREKAFLADNKIKLGLGFCRQCRGCLASCPHGVEIPELMRTYMYACQYGNFHLARETIKRIPASQGLTACAACGDCTARCAHSAVPIKDRLEELKTIYC